MRDIDYISALLNTDSSLPNQNPNAGVNNDGVVNVCDIAIQNFNKHE